MLSISIVLLACLWMSRTLNATTLDSRHHHGTGKVIVSDYLGFFRDAILNVHYNPFPEAVDGRTWPSSQQSLSMAGQRRLDNYVAAVMTVVHDSIPGHIIETGVWRGGASILAAKALSLVGESQSRHVYFSDSFRGIPPPPKDAKDNVIDKDAWKLSILNDNSVNRVRESARSFGLNMANVTFVEGFFNESLPALVKQNPQLRFSVVRLDGDTYFSTMDAITVLYPLLNKGGFIIIDDYLDWVSCKHAIDDYRREHGITEPITLVPHKKGEHFRGAFWRKGVTNEELPYCPGANPSVRPRSAHNPATLVKAPVNDCWEGQIHLPMCKEFANAELKYCI